MQLVIVESPAKAKTINRYLGPGYDVRACMGHVRDLPPSDLGIDLARGFDPTYEVLPAKRRVVKDLRKAASGVDGVFLATDLDREGEAIAWHLLHALELDPSTARRVVFNEITKAAIRQAFANPRKLDMDKVNAQQARRILDRIVGYQLSPLLQTKMGRGLSAGRVQSVAVRLVVEREREIRSFIPRESWRILGCFTTVLHNAASTQEQWERFRADAGDAKAGRSQKEQNAWLSKHHCLFAELVRLGGDEFKAADAARARSVAEALGFVTDRIDERVLEGYKDMGLKGVTIHGRLDGSRSPAFRIAEIQKKRTTSRPGPPFTTATLQQAASTALGFNPSRTMRVAQQLYEGVDTGEAEGPVALITYMRTDSTNLSKDSVDAARDLIDRQFGKDYLPDKPNVYAKTQRAQEAHEAIRPTDVALDPDSVRKNLTADQYKLYKLIWRRFVACQMAPARWDSTTVYIAADTTQGQALFRASGRRLVFDGFLRVMGTADGNDVILPELAQDQPVAPIQVEPQQQYTSPPARYTEASLIKKLESEGIGRPSTYAAIIQTVQDRGYVDLIDKKLQPTARGEMVTDKLIEHFPDIMDVKFTSYMEDELDKIEEAHLDWVHVLNEFYGPFKQDLDRARVEMQKTKAEPSPYECKECGKPMVYRLGRNGRFLSCSGFPECKGTMNIDADGKPVADVKGEHPCPQCGRDMVMRRSRLGPFLGCSGYPECSVTMPCDDNGVALKKVKPEDIHEHCTECDSPMAVKFARGRAFLGCSAYPKCKATRPIPAGLYVEKPPPEDAGARCDKCGRPMVIRKSRRGPFLSCSGFPRCRNAMPTEKLEHLRELEREGKIPDPPPETNGKNGRNGRARNGNVPKTKDGKVDVAALGPPPDGFAWTRTGRPVVETWPEKPLKCPDCGGEVAMRSGRYGPYFGCTNYPKCSFVANTRGAAKKRAEKEAPTPPKPKPIPTEIPCEECGAPMLIRTGRTGPFLGCSKYPKCRFSKPLPEGESADTLATSGAR
jgi:DNA topoisomerase-1